MSKLKKAGLSVRVISLMLALASLAVVLGFAAPKPAAALNNCGTEILYFSDASHTVEVGDFLWEGPRCGCHLHSWGTTSPYSITGPSDIC